MTNEIKANFGRGSLGIHDYILPDRQEVVELMAGNIKSLSSIQFWEVEDGPVVIDKNGESEIWMNNRWCGMDSWEAIFEGIPLSFHQFREKWPNLAAETKFRSPSSFSEEQPG